MIMLINFILGRNGKKCVIYGNRSMSNDDHNTNSSI